MVYRQVPSDSGLKICTIRRAWSWWRLLLLRSYAKGSFGSIAGGGTDLKEKRLSSPHRFFYKSIVNAKGIIVIFHRLRSAPINRWTVPPYCSRWLVFTRALRLDFYLLSSRRYKFNTILFLFTYDNNKYVNNVIPLFILSFMFYILLSLSYSVMMEVCSSSPSSEDHYILREIVLRRTKDINL
jgi:hypothetical protein